MKIGYARVSTGEQNLDLQLDALQEADCERIYEEKTSGVKDNRPEMGKAMDALREGDTFVVWRLDRFGRSLKDLLAKVEKIEERGADFVSLTEGIDTTTAQGTLAFHLFGALAEFERKLAHQRTMAGLRAARERGRVGGKPRAISRKQMPIVQQMMKSDEYEAEDICEELEISRSTLYRYVGPDGERRKYKEEEEVS